MTWTNWAGNQSAEPAVVEHPRDVEEVAAAVKAAATDGRTLRAAGSGHSFTPAVVTDGTLLHLDRLSGVVSADPATGLVTVLAGTPLHALNAELARLGLAMSNLGDIDRQTVAGAISTGTHGTGRGLGGIATQVRALQLVTGDGSVVRCSPTERPALFSAARVGIGALGVLTEVTLQCEPAFVLLAREDPFRLPEVLEHLDGWVEEHEHVEFFWFPHTDRTLTKRNDRLRPGEPEVSLSRVRAFVEDEVMANTVYGLVCRLGRARPELVPRLNRLAARLMSPRTFTAASHEVFTSPRRVRFVEMEYAVPREALRDALSLVQRVIEREQLRISFPVEVRVTAGDDIPLSTASGRDSAYVAIHVFRGESFDRYFREVERGMRDLEGRPHWGKMHWRTAEDLRPVYPRFEEFLAVREQVDPDRVFANAYVRQVLGS